MYNNPLDEFIKPSSSKEYNYGTVTDIKSNNTIIVQTSNKITLVIKDEDDSYLIGDNLLLAYTNDSINSAFIIKKTNSEAASSVSNIIVNGLD